MENTNDNTNNEFILNDENAILDIDVIEQENNNNNLKNKEKMLKEKIHSYEDVKKSCLEYFSGDELATDVWIKKYALKDSDGNLYELNPSDMHKRMAKEFSRIEKKYEKSLSKEKQEQLSEYGKSREKLTEEKIYNYFNKFEQIDKVLLWQVLEIIKIILL